MLYAAESWGTGRAVSRIPRVGGSGTHRSGQGAFGNMCRGGRMFNPNVIWRRWHRKVNLTQRRHAVASAIAASAVPSLVLARGHRVNQVPEVPLVVDSLAISKTSDVISVLQRLGLKDELDKVKETRKIRAGQGKYRNRRYKTRKGPLIVYTNEDRLICQTSRNIPGVDVCHVDRLNLLQLSPGGHLGRLIVWTKPAFERLNHIFGTTTTPGVGKKGYVLERPLLTNANVARLINSSEVQAIVRPKHRNLVLHDRQKRNPLKNKAKMDFLNPYAKVARAAETKAAADNKNTRAERKKKRSVARKTFRKHGNNFVRTYRKELAGASGRSEQDYKDYIRSLKIGKDAMKEGN
jgi:large subunit ribosomal protein L4e